MKFLKTDTVKGRISIVLLSFLAVAAIIPVYAFIAHNGFGIPCVIKAVTHLSCPGCGNTRAAIALLTFRFKDMLNANLLFPLEISYILWVCGHSSFNYIKKHSFSYKTPSIIIDVAVLVLVIAWWVVRNIIGM